MKSLFSKIIIVTLFVAIAGGIYFWQSRSTKLANLMSDMMGVEVTVEDIQLGWNTLTVQGFTVGALPESKLDHSFKASDISITVHLTDLFGKMMTIQDVTIHGPSLGVELYDSSGKENNWTRIADNISKSKKSESTDEQQAQTETKEKTRAGKKVLIKHLLVTDMKITAIGLPMNPDPVVLKPKKPLELYDVGGDNPLPYDQISRIIVGEVMKHIASVEGLSGVAKNLILNTPEELLKGNIPGTGTKGQEIKKAVKKLFGK